MSPGSCGQQDQAIDARGHGLAGVPQGGDVRQHPSAILVNSLRNAFGRSDAGDHQRDLVPNDNLKIGIAPGIRLVKDQVGGIERIGPARGFDLRKPVAEDLRRTCIERREAADDPASARGDDKVRARNQKHRRNDNRQAQALAQRAVQRCFGERRSGHQGVPAWFKCFSPGLANMACGFRVSEFFR